jgi:predicted AAA+ superfamily ATPase
MIKRKIEIQLLESIKPGKVLVLSGARRVGKTILLKKISEQLKSDFLFVNGEDFAVQEALKRRTIQNYRNFLGNRKILIIDEAQKIEDIGSILKLMIDSIEDLKIIISGSSSFDILNLTGEPLTGRKINFTLFPISESEIIESETELQRKDNLIERLIYGNYPEIISINDRNEKKEYLTEIINSYLLKDILIYDKIKNSSKIFNLLRLIAFQVGNEVSYQELGSQLSMSKNTIERYLDLLSKVYVLHKVEGFSKNLRKEVTKQPKWYFIDNGIRNAIIANFASLEFRNDIGQLWENYIISERIKFQNYKRIRVNNFFWRTYDQQEIDWVEEKEGKLFAFELKWNAKSSKVPKAWQKNYSNSEFMLVNQENYLEFVL